MKFFRLIILITLSFQTLILFPGTTQESGIGKEVLKIEVYAGDTGQPLKNADVEIHGTGILGVTGEDGVFILPYSKNMKWITVSCPGFKSQKRKISYPGNQELKILLEPNSPHLQENVEVIGQPIEKEVQSVVRVNEMTGIKSVQTTEALLVDQAGIDVHRTSPGGDKGKGVSIRGFDESRTLILLNGRPLNGSGVMGGDYVDWSSLTLEGVERIEVLRGGKSAEYGNTLGGVINIVTQRAGRKPKTSINLSYGSQNTANGVISHQGTIKEFLSYGFSAGNWITDGYLRNNKVNRKSFSGNLSLKLSPTATLECSARYSFHERGFIVENKIGGDYYDNEYPESSYSAGGGPGLQFQGGDYTWGDGSYWKNSRSQFDVILKKSWQNTDLQATLYMNDQDRTEYFFSITDKEKLILERDAKPEDMTWGWKLKALSLLGKHKLKYGMDGIHLRYGGGEIKNLDPAYFKKLPTITSTTVEAVRRHSLFLEDLWSISDKMDVSIGLRYDRYKGQNPEFETSASTHLQGLSPKVSLSLDLGHGNMDFSMSKVFRFPTCPEYYWYYAGFQPPNRTNLLPEEAIQWEMGLAQKFGSLKINFRLYYYRVDNYIRTIFGYRPSRVVYNIDQAQFRGSEFELSCPITRNLFLSMNYTYQWAAKEGDVLDMSNELTERLTELPEHKLNVRLVYRVKSGLKVHLTLRYVGSRSVLMGNFTEKGATTLAEMPEYITGDIYTTIPLVNKNGFTWNFKMALENIFNSDYEEVFGFPMPGRRLFAGMDIRF